MDTDKVIQDLNRRFAAPLPEVYQRRIIFWYDQDREFEDKLDEVVLENATVIALKATALPNHRPERTVCLVFYKILINRIVVQIQSCPKYTAENPIRLRILQSADGRHDCHVQLCRNRQNLILTDNLHTAVFVIKIYPVILDLLPHSRSRYKPHLVHPNGNQVCPEFFAVKLYIQKPVIIRAIICERTVHQIIRGQIVHREQLLHGKRIVAFSILMGEKFYSPSPPTNYVLLYIKYKTCWFLPQFAVFCILCYNSRQTYAFQEDFHL